MFIEKKKFPLQILQLTFINTLEAKFVRGFYTEKHQRRNEVIGGGGGGRVGGGGRGRREGGKRCEVSEGGTRENQRKKRIQLEKKT